MATLAVTQLKKEYARLLGRYEQIEREIEYVVGVENILKETARIELERYKMRERLDQIAAIVTQLEPGWVRERVRPVSPRKNKHGTFSKAVYQILREAKAPMKSRDISRIMAERMGIEPIQRELNRLDTFVLVVLKRRIGKTIVVVSEKPRRWAIMPRDQVIAALHASQATPARPERVLPQRPKALHSNSPPIVSESP